MGEVQGLGFRVSNSKQKSGDLTLFQVAMACKLAILGLSSQLCC